jgi:hypothetical protein
MTRAELISFRVDANQVHIAKYASAADGAKWSPTDNARPHLEEHEKSREALTTFLQPHFRREAFMDCT